MLKLYDHPLSGNCYKARLFMQLVGLPFETEFMDVLARKNMTEAFGRISPLRQIPVLQDGEAHIADSHAHRRYMASNRVLRLWVEMVRELRPSMIVPQHGMPFRGEAMEEMLAWLEGLQCGVDLMGPVNYRPNPQRAPLVAA